MRSILYLKQRRFLADDIERYTHVVIGALNKVPLVPPSRALTPKEFNALEPEARAIAHEELRTFATEETGGRFAVKPMRWATSLEQAQSILADFSAEKTGDAVKYTDLAIVEVSETLEHA